MERPCKVNPELAGELPCGCRCLLAVFFPQRPRSVSLPTGDVSKDVGHGGRNGRSSKAWAVPRQGKTGFALGRFEVGCEVLVVVLTAGMPGSFVSNPVLLRETRRR